MQKLQNWFKKAGSSRLAALRVDNIDDSLEWFGNYTPHGEIPIILIPRRSSCAPYIYVPQGAYGIITRHGEFQEVIKEGGIHFCLPWTRIQYLITQQDLLFDIPVKACPTYDNIFVEIDIAILFRCKEDDNSIKQFVYNISINQLNEQLEAAITERLRVLVREKTHLEVYQIKGKEHTGDMLDFLNRMFSNKGLEFNSIIITAIRLPNDIAQPLDQKAQYGSMNEYEKTRHAYDMRVLNDNSELELIRQQKEQYQQQTNSRFEQNYQLSERELKLIQAEAKKSVAEIKEKTITEEKRINAEMELQAQKIRSETQVIQAKLEAEGQAEVNNINVDARNYCELTIAKQMNQVADMNAEVTKIEGETEAQLTKILAFRRQYELLNAKLDAIEAMADNKNVKIFGDQKESAISQMAAFNLFQGNKIMNPQ